MNLLKLIQSKSRSFYVLLILLGIVSSLTNIGILMTINSVISGKPVLWTGINNGLMFALLVLLSFFSTAYFQKYMAELTNNIMFDIELSVIQKIRQSSYESLERLGREKVYAAISDARVLGRVPEIFITLLNAVITIVCSLSYLFWVSFYSGAVILVIMAGLLFVYLFRNKRIMRDLNKVRDLQDLYYGGLRELLDGFKQIRISSVRNNSLYKEHLLTNREHARELSISTSKRYVINELTGVYSWYLVLGVVLFLLPVAFKIDIRQLGAFITTVLFMMAPVSQLIMFFPFYSAFKIAIQRINNIDQKLGADSVPIVNGARSRPFSSIRFENIVYRHHTEENGTFYLDLADFRIENGQIVFIIGGNGSGKTTFINLMSGLSKPVSGKIFIDDREVSWDEYCAFGDNMAVVFTDQHLFRENYDGHQFEKNDLVTQLSELFNVAPFLKLNRDKNWVDVRLSKGQQKRLALLLAMLEDKPILILDEWAAEQDPGNRSQFYTIWLEQMRRMGKTILVVSHDDDFYHVADRVVKFNYGSIVSDSLAGENLVTVNS